MLKYTQEFKVQCVEKSLSKKGKSSQKELATSLGIGLSTLNRWINLAKTNELEKSGNIMSIEKSPQDWSKSERLDVILHCHAMNDSQISTYCRENGLYPHHIKEWKLEFLSIDDISSSHKKKEQKKLKLEVKRLQKELNRKDKALAETAALLVLSKKCQAIWEAKEVD